MRCMRYILLTFNYKKQQKGIEIRCPNDNFYENYHAQVTIIINLPLLTGLRKVTTEMRNKINIWLTNIYLRVLLRYLYVIKITLFYNI